MKLHLISLQQDADEIQKEMDSYEEMESNEYQALEIEHISLNGQWIATNHLLSVATDIMNNSNERYEAVKNNNQLPPHLLRMVNLGMDGADIMHGELKVLMLEAEQQLELAQEAEEESGEAMDSMERKYWEGVLEAYGEMYSLTYDIAFSKADKDVREIRERFYEAQ
jgi:hypothetical protein